MPTEELTERQTEILALVRKNKSALEISKALKISPNGVHQHIRRMRDNGVNVSRPGIAAAKPTSKPKPGAKPKPVLKQAALPSAGGNAFQLELADLPERDTHMFAVTMNDKLPLQAIKARRDQLSAELKIAAAQTGELLTAARVASEKEQALHAKYGAELKALDKAEALLTPAKKPTPAAKPKPKRVRPSRAKGKSAPAAKPTLAAAPAALVA